MAGRQVGGGVLTVRIADAQILKPAVAVMQQKVYVKLQCMDEIPGFGSSSGSWVQSKVVEDCGMNPSFNEKLQVPFHGSISGIRCELWVVGSSRFSSEQHCLLGFAALPAPLRDASGRAFCDYPLMGPDGSYSGQVGLALTLKPPRGSSKSGPIVSRGPRQTRSSSLGKDRGAPGSSAGQPAEQPLAPARPGLVRGNSHREELGEAATAAAAEAACLKFQEEKQKQERLDRGFQPEEGVEEEEAVVVVLDGQDGMRFQETGKRVLLSPQGTRGEQQPQGALLHPLTHHPEPEAILHCSVGGPGPHRGAAAPKPKVRSGPLSGSHKSAAERRRAKSKSGPLSKSKHQQGASQEGSSGRAGGPVVASSLRESPEQERVLAPVGPTVGQRQASPELVPAGENGKDVQRQAGGERSKSAGGGPAYSTLPTVSWGGEPDPLVFWATPEDPGALAMSPPRKECLNAVYHHSQSLGMLPRSAGSDHGSFRSQSSADEVSSSQRRLEDVEAEEVEKRAILATRSRRGSPASKPGGSAGGVGLSASSRSGRGLKGGFSGPLQPKRRGGILSLGAANLVFPRFGAAAREAPGERNPGCDSFAAAQGLHNVGGEVWSPEGATGQGRGACRPVAASEDRAASGTVNLSLDDILVESENETLAAAVQEEVGEGEGPCEGVSSDEMVGVSSDLESGCCSPGGVVMRGPPPAPSGRSAMAGNCQAALLSGSVAQGSSSGSSPHAAGCSGPGGAEAQEGARSVSDMEWQGAGNAWNSHATSAAGAAVQPLQQLGGIATAGPTGWQGRGSTWRPMPATLTQPPANPSPVFSRFSGLGLSGMDRGFGAALRGLVGGGGGGGAATSVSPPDRLGGHIPRTAGDCGGAQQPLVWRMKRSADVAAEQICPVTVAPIATQQQRGHLAVPVGSHVAVAAVVPRQPLNFGGAGGLAGGSSSCGQVAAMDCDVDNLWNVAERGGGTNAVSWPGEEAQRHSAAAVGYAAHWHSPISVFGAHQ